jgi:hypothetical protein
LCRVGEGAEPTRRIGVPRRGAESVELGHVGIVSPRGGDVGIGREQRIVDVDR